MRHGLQPEIPWPPENSAGLSEPTGRWRHRRHSCARSWRGQNQRGSTLWKGLLFLLPRSGHSFLCWPAAAPLQTGAPGLRHGHRPRPLQAVCAPYQRLFLRAYRPLFGQESFQSSRGSLSWCFVSSVGPLWGTSPKAAVCPGPDLLGQPALWVICATASILAFAAPLSMLS